MGNQQSNIKMDNEKVLKKAIDAIAAKYILTQNFQDMIDLNNPEVCNNLVIITSQIIKKSLNWRSILYLDQYLKGKNIINKITKDNILYFDKNDLNDLDIKNSTQKKECVLVYQNFILKLICFLLLLLLH